MNTNIPIKENKNNQDKKKILIVDDDPDICVTLRKIFEQNGFMADSFIEPLLALENFKAGLYDLLLLDIKMSQMGGFQLHQEMKKIDKEVKVCFLTATEMDFEKFRKVKEFYVLDKERFLRKPIESKEIIKEITEILNSVTRG
ncbi:MAG TPA: response regulator [Methylomirabilota bacterium]|nr:response regulator [Methylomirabilota bacterium]